MRLRLGMPESAVLGLLDDYSTRSGYVITPVVMWSGEPVELRANAPVVGWMLEIRLRDLRLKEGEYVEVAFLG